MVGMETDSRVLVEEIFFSFFFLIAMDKKGQNRNDVSFSNIGTAQSYVHCCRLTVEEVQQI